jgi:hypothetical protein
MEAFALSTHYEPPVNYCVSSVGSDEHVYKLIFVKYEYHIAGVRKRPGQRDICSQF